MADAKRTAKLIVAVISSVVRIEHTGLRRCIETALESPPFPFAKHLRIAFFQEKTGRLPEDITVAQFRTIGDLVHLASADAETNRRRPKHEEMAEAFDQSGSPGIEHFARPRRHDQVVLACRTDEFIQIRVCLRDTVLTFHINPRSNIHAHAVFEFIPFLITVHTERHVGFRMQIQTFGIGDRHRSIVVVDLYLRRYLNGAARLGFRFRETEVQIKQEIRTGPEGDRPFTAGFRDVAQLLLDGFRIRFNPLLRARPMVADTVIRQMREMRRGFCRGVETDRVA